MQYIGIKIVRVQNMLQLCIVLAWQFGYRRWQIRGRDKHKISNGKVAPGS